MVASINPCPKLSTQHGRVVTSTITHFNTDVYDLKVSGQAEPLHITGLHRLYSEDRKDWVRTQNLKIGEHLHTRFGHCIVISKVHDDGIYRVYNFEVETEHKYFVGAEEILGHNGVPQTGCAFDGSDLPPGTRLPKSNGSWSGMRGESDWTSTNPKVNAITGGKPIVYVNGYPDLNAYSKADMVIVDNKGRTLLTGDSNADFKLADKAYADANKMTEAQVKQMRADQGLTWHHNEDGYNMQLVPKDLNNNIPHAGGASNLRNGDIQ